MFSLLKFRVFSIILLWDINNRVLWTGVVLWHPLLQSWNHLRSRFWKPFFILMQM